MSIEASSFNRAKRNEFSAVLLSLSTRFSVRQFVDSEGILYDQDNYANYEEQFRTKFYIAKIPFSDCSNECLRRRKELISYISLRTMSLKNNLYAHANYNPNFLSFTSKLLLKRVFIKK